MTINEQKLTLSSHKKNPLRDKLRAMSNEQLLAEKEKSLKHINRSKADWNYNFFIDYLCECRGITKATPGIWV